MGKELSFEGKLAKTLNLGRAGAITGCSISIDDKTVASCAADNKVLLWEVATGQCEGSLDGHKTDVIRCAFGNELMVTGSRDGDIILWKYADVKKCSRITVHKKAITNCKISPNHTYLLTSSKDTNCRLWTIRNGRGEFVQGPKYFELHHDGNDYTFTGASFSGDSCAVVTSSSDGQVKLWDAQSGEKLMNLCTEKEPIVDAHFSSDGKYVIVLTKNSVKIWNISKQKTSWCIEDTKGFQAIDSHPTENMFILVAMDGTIAGYDITQKEEMFKRPTGHSGPVLSCSFSASGCLAVTGGIDGKILVWS